jgi:hypothetical protein
MRRKPAVAAVVAAVKPLLSTVRHLRRFHRQVSLPVSSMWPLRSLCHLWSQPMLQQHLLLW